MGKHTFRQIASLFLALSTTTFCYGQTEGWMKAGPYLQEVTATAATVVFEHTIPSLSWIEVREKGTTDVKSFYQVEHGQIRAYSQIIDHCAALPVQNFAVRATGLKPATTYQYRVRGKKVNSINANGVTLSSLSSDAYNGPWYDFQTDDPQSTEHHIFVTSDMHNKPDSLAALLKFLDYKTCDHFLYNGDMTNYLQASTAKGNAKPSEPYAAYINTSVNLFAKNKPFELVRGNHETRGDISRHFLDYFPRQNGKIYSMTRWGDMVVVMLDCGEDKLDSHVEYYGMASYYPYREEQATWLREALQSEEFKTARYRLLVAHFPLMVGSGDVAAEFDGEPHYIRLMRDMLLNAGFDLAIAGHYHPNTYTLLEKNYKNRGNQFEEYVIGAHTAMRIDIENGEIKLKIVTTKGDVVYEKTVKDETQGQKQVYITQ